MNMPNVFVNCVYTMLVLHHGKIVFTSNKVKALFFGVILTLNNQVCMFVCVGKYLL